MANRRNLIAYCGLYCGDCFIYQGKIADLARDLRKELRTTKFHRFANMISKYFKPYANYDQTYELLGMMVKLRCKRTCRNGGGPPSCKIRHCCIKNQYEGCWECEEFEKCKKLEFLGAVHKDAHLKNIIKIKKQGIPKFLQGKKYW
jgi:hypothetical protein